MIVDITIYDSAICFQAGWKKDPQGIVNKWTELCEKKGITNGFRK